MSSHASEWPSARGWSTQPHGVGLARNFSWQWPLDGKRRSGSDSPGLTGTAARPGKDHPNYRRRDRHGQTVGSKNGLGISAQDMVWDCRALAAVPVRARVRSRRRMMWGRSFGRLGFSKAKHRWQTAPDTSVRDKQGRCLTWSGRQAEAGHGLARFTRYIHVSYTVAPPAGTLEGRPLN